MMEDDGPYLPPKASKVQYLQSFAIGCLMAIVVFILMNDIFSHAAGR